jgi:hypothetical protein
MSKTIINDSRLQHYFWMTTVIFLAIDSSHRGDLQLVIPKKVGRRRNKNATPHEVKPAFTYSSLIDATAWYTIAFYLQLRMSREQWLVAAIGPPYRPLTLIAEHPSIVEIYSQHCR